MIELLLVAMGETPGTWTIQLPATIRSDILPPADWDFVNPAQQLSGLAEAFGMRVVYRWDSDSVALLPLGVGADLPDGYIARESPSVSGLTTPESILLVGAPVRYQCRVLLEPVGLEWDKSIQPIDDLTYAPTIPLKRHKVRFTITNVVVGAEYTITINGVDYQYTAIGGDTVSDIATALSAPINPALNAKGFQSQPNQAAPAGGGPGTVDVLGPANGDTFRVVCFADTLPAKVQFEVIDSGSPGGKTWKYSYPPNIWNMVATNRLTFRQAKQHADESVFRWYRIVNADPVTRKFPLDIPGFGKLVRIQQLLPQDEQIEQINPAPADLNLRNKITGEPLIQDYYDGYSRNKPAACYGSYFWPVAGVVFGPNLPGQDGNTSAAGRVNVDFTIDHDLQLVKFSQPVYIVQGSTVAAADIVLQTAFQIRDQDTNQVIRSQAKHDFGGETTRGLPFVIRQQDFEVNIVARYAFGEDPAKQPATPNKVIGTLTDLNDALPRARYYMNREVAKWELREARIRLYNGIVPIVCDGAIQSVTWSVGEGGVTTEASRNSEHAPYLPSFPERLRIEYQNAAKAKKDPINVNGKPKV